MVNSPPAVTVAPANSTTTSQTLSDDTTREAGTKRNKEKASGTPSNEIHRSTRTPAHAVIPIEFIDIAEEEEKTPQRRDLRETIKNNLAKFDEGYDTDGEIGPFMDCVEEEGIQDFEEDEAGVTLDSTRTATTNAGDGGNGSSASGNDAGDSNCDGGDNDRNDSPSVPTNDADVFVDIDFEVMLKMKTQDFKNELKIRGAKVGGNKKELHKRLKQCILDKKPVLSQSNLNKKKKAKAKANNGKGTTKPKKKKGFNDFASGAIWRLLKPMVVAVTEPTNPSFKVTRAPTIEEKDAEFIPVKHNYSETFERPEFEGTYEKDITYANGMPKKNPDGTTKTETAPRSRGMIDPSFKKKHKLSSKSRPEDFANIVLPFKKNVHGNKEYLSVRQICNWTNLKATLSGAGKGGTCYQDFTPFSPEEIRQHLGLYVIQGLSPSPRVELKFAPQTKDKVHGNDFIYHSFGPGAERRHRHFKAFLALQDPGVTVPDKKKYPNWKIRPLIQWMNFLFPMIWLLGMCFSIDEMTMGFKGRHQDKKRITYKKEGDGFQADALCDDGFTYQVYMRNDPAPKKYLKQGLSPLHARVMALFDTVKDKYHHCAMDNLYNSALFCRAAFNHAKKVLCHGVTRKGNRGIPECVVQVEAKNREEQLKVRGTTKAAILEGDANCPNLLASSVYDTKPVHYLSMASTELKWIEVSKPVYNVDTGKVEDLRFLRMNHIDNYNKTMGNVDVADQLRGNYRFDHWLRNRKWWWSIFFWGFGVLLTNAYIMYVKVNEEEGIPRSKLLSQHDFRKAVALAWINKDEYEKDVLRNVSSQDSTTNSEVISRRGRRRRGDADSTTATGSAVSSLTFPDEENSTKMKKNRCTQITDTSLSSQLLCRFVTTEDHHPIYPLVKNARCGLHRWMGKETEKFVMFCETCNVNLCLDCYKPFHTDRHVFARKEKAQREMGRKKRSR